MSSDETCRDWSAIRESRNALMLERVEDCKGELNTMRTALQAYHNLPEWRPDTLHSRVNRARAMARVAVQRRIRAIRAAIGWISEELSSDSSEE